MWLFACLPVCLFVCLSREIRTAPPNHTNAAQVHAPLSPHTHGELVGSSGIKKALANSLSLLLIHCEDFNAEIGVCFVWIFYYYPFFFFSYEFVFPQSFAYFFLIFALWLKLILFFVSHVRNKGCTQSNWIFPQRMGWKCGEPKEYNEEWTLWCSMKRSQLIFRSFRLNCSTFTRRWKTTNKLRMICKRI
jgi:hypothetical protein